MKYDKIGEIMNNMSNDDSVSNKLNMLRWISAFLVVATHLRNIFFVENSLVAHPNAVITILYSLTGLGHQAVLVFFILSGYLISSSIFKLMKIDRFSWKIYLINRLSRLYTVLIPALILGLIADKLGMHFFNYSFYSTEMVSKTNIAHLISNFFYLQGIFTGSFGSNDPLWSLSYEFWYYIIFPCLLLAILSKTRVLKLAYSLITLTLLIFVGSQIAIYFIIWFFGVMLVLAPKIQIKSRLLMRATNAFVFLILFISIGVNRLGLIHSQIYSDLILSIIIALFIYSLVKIERNKKEKFIKTSQFLANFSYTIYLIHFPILVFCFSLLQYFGMKKLQPSSFGFGVFIVMYIVILLLAYAISLVTEAKTNNIRRYFYNKINNKTV